MFGYYHSTYNNKTKEIPPCITAKNSSCRMKMTKEVSRIAPTLLKTLKNATK